VTLKDKITMKSSSYSIFWPPVFHPEGMKEFSRWLRSRQRPTPPETIKKTQHPGGVPESAARSQCNPIGYNFPIAALVEILAHLASLRDAVDFLHCYPVVSLAKPRSTTG